MAANETSQFDSPTSGRRRPRRFHRFKYAGVLLLCYVGIAYLALPYSWTILSPRSSFYDDPCVTESTDGHPGDPVNIAMIGTDAELSEAMHVAHWYTADPLGVRSDVAIVADVVLDREYDTAPVSVLRLFGREEDVAFEQPVGHNPLHRHHVRFWKSSDVHTDGRPVWYGAASYDRGIGVSHTTGQVTHHINADVDTERDYVMSTMQEASALSEQFSVPYFHRTLIGRNAGGDSWHTDGTLRVGVIISTVNGTSPQVMEHEVR